MSTTIFPTLKNSNWKLTRTPQWKTMAPSSVCGDTRRAPLQDKPLWKWQLKNGVLQADLATQDLQAITDLFNAMAGKWDFFLWKDPEPTSLPDDPDVQANLLGVQYWPVAFTHDSVDFDRFAYQLWQCGKVEFEQVKLPTLVYNSLQQPHGKITSATLNVLWSYDAGGGGPAPAIKQLPSGIPNTFSGSWSIRTDSQALSVPVQGTLGGQSYSIGFSSPDSGTVDPPWLLTVYEISASVTYEDGALGTIIPNVTADQGLDSTYGVVSNPHLSVDGDSSTGATLTGSQLFFGRTNGDLRLTF